MGQASFEGRAALITGRGRVRTLVVDGGVTVPRADMQQH